jgi:hypothetical protein
MLKMDAVRVSKTLLTGYPAMQCHFMSLVSVQIFSFFHIIHSRAEIRGPHIFQPGIWLPESWGISLVVVWLLADMQLTLRRHDEIKHECLG